MSSMLQYARSLREEDSREPGNAGLEQRGVEVVPKDERTVGFWNLFVIWGGFSIIMTNFLLERSGVALVSARPSSHT